MTFTKDRKLNMDCKEAIRTMEKEVIHAIIGELVTKEKYKFVPAGLVGEVVRDVFDALEKREQHG